MLIFDTHKEAADRCLNDIINTGKGYSPRGMDTLELINISFSINDTKSIYPVKKRNLNYAFSIIEKMNFITGKDQSNILLKYNTNLISFYNKKDIKFDGDYAPRIGKQLSNVISELRDNTVSRRAVITIRNSDDSYFTNDHPCTLSMQFLIRDNTLHMITTMRSNDAYISTAGYDIINFTFIQNYIAKILNIEKTMYHHNVGSMHIYKQHIEKATQLLKSTNEHDNLPSNDWDISSEFMSRNIIKDFWIAEQQIRLGLLFKRTKSDILNSYLDYLVIWWKKRGTYKSNKFDKLYNYVNNNINKIGKLENTKENYKILIWLLKLA